MRADDVKLEDLITFARGDAPFGLQFAGRTAIFWPEPAFARFRAQIFDLLGDRGARAILRRMGFQMGSSVAELVQSAFTWDSQDEVLAFLARAVPPLKNLLPRDPLASPLFKEGASMPVQPEAELHLRYMGRSEQPVCATEAGYVSGILSQVLGTEIVVHETLCIGKGDATCHFIAQRAEECDNPEYLVGAQPERAQELIEACKRDALDSLKQAEQKLADTKRKLRAAAPDFDDPLGGTARSPAMRRVIDLARRVARVDSTVLVSGESGSGKERIARLLHDESPRRAGPFIAVNCGAIAETLLESELFGHAKGAFTGATYDRPGLFEAANGGTLFLDEIGEITSGMQVKLLRVLQEREIRRVGESNNRKIDVRVIAATNRDLGKEVAAGHFRQDLYYRLRVVELPVPPLRDRAEDILPLAHLLLAEAVERAKREGIEGLSAAAADQLVRYSWPGNVRELQNAMERCVALAQSSRVEVEDLPPEVREGLPQPTIATRVRPIEQIEKEYILAALRLNDGNQTRTAEQLGIATATLYRKLKAWGELGKASGASSASSASNEDT